MVDSFWLLALTLRDHKRNVHTETEREGRQGNEEVEDTCDTLSVFVVTFLHETFSQWQETTSCCAHYVLSHFVSGGSLRSKPLSRYTFVVSTATTLCKAWPEQASHYRLTPTHLFVYNSGVKKAFGELKPKSPGCVFSVGCMIWTLFSVKVLLIKLFEPRILKKVVDMPFFNGGGGHAVIQLCF